jgi:hypothetical protein
VDNGALVEKVGDRVAIAPIPDLFEPLDDKPLVALEKGKRLAAGGHVVPPEQIIAGVYRKRWLAASDERSVRKVLVNGLRDTCFSVPDQMSEYLTTRPIGPVYFHVRHETTLLLDGESHAQTARGRCIRLEA